MVYRQRINLLKDAQASYNEAKANSAQEDSHPPPESEPTKTLPPAVPPQPHAAEASADVDSPEAKPSPRQSNQGTQEFAVPAAQSIDNSQSSGSEAGAAHPIGVAKGSNSAIEPSRGWISNIVLVLSFIAPVLAARAMYKKMRAWGGSVAALVTSLVIGVISFLAIVVASNELATGEYRSWQAEQRKLRSAESDGSEGAKPGDKEAKELLASTSSTRRIVNCTQSIRGWKCFGITGDTSDGIAEWFYNPANVRNSQGSYVVEVRSWNEKEGWDATSTKWLLDKDASKSCNLALVPMLKEAACRAIKQDEIWATLLANVSR